MREKTLFLSLVLCASLAVASITLSCPVMAASGTASVVGVVHLLAYNISVSPIHITDATISWSTNGDADGTIEYGPTAGYGFTDTDPALVKNHAFLVQGLAESTIYHYRIISADSSGNLYTSQDLQFTTTQVIVPLTPVSLGSGMGGGNGGGSGTGGVSGAGVGTGIGTGVGTGVSTGTGASPGSPSGPSSPESPKESIPLSEVPTPLQPVPTATRMALSPATMALGLLAAVGLFSRRRGGANLRC